MDYDNKRIIRIILDRDVSTFKSQAEKKAKLFYESCLDEDEDITKLGAKPLLTMIDNVGGWAVLNENFDVKNWNFQKTFDSIHNTYGLECLLAWFISIDHYDSSKYILNFFYDKNVLTFPTKEYYVNRTATNVKILKAYQEYMTSVILLLGAKDENETLRHMWNVIEFETKIAEITVEEEDEKMRYWTIKQLQTEAGFIDWKKHINEAFQSIGKSITENEKILVDSSKYIKSLTSLVKNYTSTDKGKE